MAIPTREEMLAAVEEVFRGQHPGAPEHLDADDPDQADLRAAWIDIRDDIVNRWTDDAFFELFPGAPRRLDPNDPSHSLYVDYWLDIRDRIRDGDAPRYDLESLALAGDPPPLVSSQTNPYIGTVWEPIWDDGYAAGYDSPGTSLLAPEHLQPGEVEVWQAGVEAGQYAAEAEAHRAAGHPVEPTGAHTTTSEELSDEFGLPTIRISFPGEPIGRTTIDAGMAYLVVELSLTGNVSVEPPEAVRGVSVDQSGYRVEVQNEVEGLFSGLRINGIGGGLTNGPISVGTTFGNDLVTTEVRQVSASRIVFIGQERLPDIPIQTYHGEATLRGQFGFQVSLELVPKPQPVPVDEPWYEEAWDWVSDHAAEIAIVGVVVVAGVAITVGTFGAAGPEAAAGGGAIVEWALAGAAL
jgi:hypothetical protein